MPAERALEYTDTPMYVQGLSLVAGSTRGSMDPEFDFTTFPEVVKAARDAYGQAGIDDPSTQLSLAEVHDCFTPTEIVLMEDLGFSEAGHGWKDVLGGDFDAGRTVADQSRRRIEVVRSSGWCQRTAHALRGMAAVPRRRR